MATLGDTFREERERRGKTVSEAAEATRIKPTHIEALERADFSSISSPIYAKGFIKLYAEWLELDPAPLVREYMASYAPRERPNLVPEPKPRPAPSAWLHSLQRRLRAKPSAPTAGEPPPSRPVVPRRRLPRIARRWPGHRALLVAVAAAAVVGAIAVLVSVLGKAGSSGSAGTILPAGSNLLESPPEPYLPADAGPQPPVRTP